MSYVFSTAQRNAAFDAVKAKALSDIPEDYRDFAQGYMTTDLILGISNAALDAVAPTVVFPQEPST